MDQHASMMKRLCLGAGALGLLATPVSMLQAAPLQPHYIIVNLGSLGGEGTSALGVNDHGQVVGWSTTAAGQRHAFMYSNGFMTDLGTLVGGTHSDALAINDMGVVVGESGINGPGPGFPEIQQGFVWQQGQMSSVGALYCPCSFNVRYGISALSGINDSGDAAGWSETVRGSWVLHAAAWKSQALQDLGGGAGDWSISHVFAINDAGEMIGDYAAGAGQLGTNIFDRQANLWRNDGTHVNLGTLPGFATSVGLALDPHGDVAGWSGSADGSTSHAFLWSGGGMLDLGVLPGYANSTALALNGYRQVVGSSTSADGSLSHAFLWSHGQMFDLNDLVPQNAGWVLNQAAGINMFGQIVGTGIYNGVICGYLLLPDGLWYHGPDKQWNPAAGN